MSLKKTGFPVKLEIIKKGSFSINENVLAEKFLQNWPNKQITVDNIHEGLKQMGIDNYSSEDLSGIMNRLQAVGFSINSK